MIQCRLTPPEYDPDIDGDSQPTADKKQATVSIQGMLEPIPESSVLEDDNSIAPENNMVSQNQQETDWSDAPTIQIPGVSSTTLDRLSNIQQMSSPALHSRSRNT